MELVARLKREVWIDDYAVLTGDVDRIDISDYVKSLTPGERQHLVFRVNVQYGRDLDFVAEAVAADILKEHGGPYTLDIDADELQEFIDENQLEVGNNRYVVADEPGSLWGHLFANDPDREVMTKFVYDREEKKVIAAQVIGGHSQNGPWWADLSQDAIFDLEDSLKNANEDALDNPLKWGLIATNELPEWAAAAAPTSAP